MRGAPSRRPCSARGGGAGGEVSFHRGRCRPFPVPPSLAWFLFFCTRRCDESRSTTALDLCNRRLCAVLLSGFPNSRTGLELGCNKILCIQTHKIQQDLTYFSS